MNKIKPNINPDFKLTPDSQPYLIKENEAHLFHVALTDKIHMSEASKYEEQRRIVKYHHRVYQQCTTNGGKFGNAQHAELIHNGEKYIMEQRKLAEERAKSDKNDSNKIAENYLKVFGYELPTDTTEEDIKQQVRVEYERRTEQKPGNKGTATLLNELVEL